MAEAGGGSSSSEDEANGSRTRRSANDRCVCPPAPSTSRSRVSPLVLPATSGNRTFGFRMMLWGRHGYHLTILPSGKVRTTDQEYNKYAMMQLSSAGVGEVRIKGLESNLYLAMNKEGKLYGEADGTEDATVFVEAFLASYSTFLSRKWAHLGWYVAIKKNGRIKPGNKTKWGQKAMQFLPRRRS